MQSFQIRRIIRLHPVRERVAQVHQGLTQGTDFPVEHRLYFGRIPVAEDNVINTVIAVQDGVMATSGWHVCLEPMADIAESAYIRRDDTFITAVPAQNLALHIPLWFPKVFQARCKVIHLVQLDQLFPELPAETPRIGG